MVYLEKYTTHVEVLVTGCGRKGGRDERDVRYEEGRTGKVVTVKSRGTVNDRLLAAAVVLTSAFLFRFPFRCSRKVSAGFTP